MSGSALRGALLGNEVGTGKTLTFLMERKLYLDARLQRLEQLGFDESDDVEAELGLSMPTLLMAPANLVEQHFNEIGRYFPKGTFHVRSFHGSANNTSHNAALAQAVMSMEQLFAEMTEAVSVGKTSLVSDLPSP